MHIKLIFMLTLVVLAFLFILQNVAAVEIQFLAWSVQISRALLMFLMLSTGTIMGWLLHSYVKHRKGYRSNHE